MATYEMIGLNTDFTLFPAHRTFYENKGKRNTMTTVIALDTEIGHIPVELAVVSTGTYIDILDILAPYNINDGYPVGPEDRIWAERRKKAERYHAFQNENDVIQNEAVRRNTTDNISDLTVIKTSGNIIDIAKLPYMLHISSCYPQSQESIYAQIFAEHFADFDFDDQVVKDYLRRMVINMDFPGMPVTGEADADYYDEGVFVSYYYPTQIGLLAVNKTHPQFGYLEPGLAELCLPDREQIKTVDGRFSFPLLKDPSPTKGHLRIIK